MSADRRKHPMFVSYYCGKYELWSRIRTWTFYGVIGFQMRTNESVWMVPGSFAP